MAFTFSRNTQSVKEIYASIEKGELIVDSTYQRRKVWAKHDKIRLIETMLLGLVVPEVFFWKAKVDPTTGTAVTHIVDGQQRIDAICGFINGEFKLSRQYLIEEESRSSFGDLSFASLPEATKVDIWSYKISVVDIDRSCTRADIMRMFYRLNLTEYSLNRQEKRKSFDSKFGSRVEELSKNSFWKAFRVFSASDYQRMKDMQYCASIYILAAQGVVDQTNDSIINLYYTTYEKTFDEDKAIANRILNAMKTISHLTDKDGMSFASKKAQMYTLFSLSFYMIDKKIEMDDQILSRYKAFINAYCDFKNEDVFHFDDQELRQVYESIKRYKLAASEGINKLHNRTIRLEILIEILLSENPKIQQRLLQLWEMFKNKRK